MASESVVAKVAVPSSTSDAAPAPVAKPGKRTIAVVLAGAVARGAFEAGVVRALAEADVNIVRIVATSSGALNGTLLAAAVRKGNVRAGAELLHTLWHDHATWTEVFHTSLSDLLKREGLSDQKKLLALLSNNLKPTTLDPANPINLRLVVAPLDGTDRQIGTSTVTTYEKMLEFNEGDFETQHGLDQVFAAATASAAFPLVFTPVVIPGIGPCVDGGTVNNTPIGYALAGAIGAAVDAVVVVATSVEHLQVPSSEVTGVGLIGHLADMLIGERLVRDLESAVKRNDKLDRLNQLVSDGTLTAAQLDSVREALGWQGRKNVDVIRIRPEQELPGTAFTGFFEPSNRAKLLEAGYKRGFDVLGKLGWLPADAPQPA